MENLKKYWKLILITAGVIASAVFYVFYPDEETPLSRGGGMVLLESESTAPEEADQSDLSVITYEGSASGEENAAAFEGFTDEQKEEIRELIKEAVSESVREALKEELDSMLESGKLTDAVTNYAQVQSGLVNINTADIDELKTLTGIGDAKARAIVDYRNENGAFESAGELTNVSGISEGLLEKIIDSITV